MRKHISHRLRVSQDRSADAEGHEAHVEQIWTFNCWGNIFITSSWDNSKGWCRRGFEERQESRGQPARCSSRPVRLRRLKITDFAVIGHLKLYLEKKKSGVRWRTISKCLSQGRTLSFYVRRVWSKRSEDRSVQNPNLPVHRAHLPPWALSPRWALNTDTWITEKRATGTHIH